MYPDPNVPRKMGNPEKLVFMGFFIPKNPKVEHNKYHGYTARGTPNCPLIQKSQPYSFAAVYMGIITRSYGKSPVHMVNHQFIW